MKKKQATKARAMKKSNPEHAGYRLPFGVGDAIFVRTVTHYQVGRVTEIGPDSITLEDASWVADTERLSVTFATGALREVERCPSWIMIGRGAIVDVFPWAHALPKETK